MKTTQPMPRRMPSNPRRPKPLDPAAVREIERRASKLQARWDTMQRCRSFAEMCERDYPVLRRIALSRCRNWHDAEDALHDSLVYALEKLLRGGGMRSLHGLVAVNARYREMARWRALRREVHEQ